MGKGTFKCPKCDRTFAMAGHLGRHMSAMHGAPSAKTSAKGKAKGKGKGKPGRPKGRRPGRPTGLVTRLGLRNMSLDQLGELVVAARSEARRKLAELNDVFA